MIEIQGKLIKNKIDELTLQEWDVMSDIINNDDLDYSDKYMSIMEYLGADKYELTGDDLINYSKQLSSSKIKNKIVTKEIIIDGITYKPNLVKNEFKILGMDYNILEKEAKKGKSFSIYAIAVLFKKEGESKEESYKPENIKYKENLFKDLLVKDLFPYVTSILQSFETKIKLLNDINK